MIESCVCKRMALLQRGLTNEKPHSFLEKKEMLNQLHKKGGVKNASIILLMICGIVIDFTSTTKLVGIPRFSVVNLPCVNVTINLQILYETSTGDNNKTI